MKRLAAVCQLCMVVGGSVAYSQESSNTVNKSTKAVGDVMGAGSTTIDLAPTDLMRQASGKASVTAKSGKTRVNGEFKGLGQPTTFGAEFLTYVLWAVSPDGRAANLGEVLLNNDGNGRLDV